MSREKEYIVAPIAATGMVYSIIIGIAVSFKMWAFAAVMFCYGITLLGARIAQLIARIKR